MTAKATLTSERELLKPADFPPYSIFLSDVGEGGAIRGGGSQTANGSRIAVFIILGN